MCTLVLLRRPNHDWPLILGANRDEMLDRPWLPPARHWPDRPDLIGGLDETAGGSWLAMNETGVVAAILNRTGSLGPLSGKRSRGELVLDALDYPDAVEAANALVQLNPEAYRPFNLVVADNRDAFWLANRPDTGITVTEIEEGVAMLTERDLNDRSAPRIARYLPQFRSAAPPDPDREIWASWQDLLTDWDQNPSMEAPNSLTFRRDNGFGTLCHTIIALPRPGLEKLPRWSFAATKPLPTPPDWLDIML